MKKNKLMDEVQAFIERKKEEFAKFGDNYDEEDYEPSDLKVITTYHMQVQKIRVALENRIRAIVQNNGRMIPKWLLKSYETMTEEEKRIEEVMKFIVGLVPVYQHWLKHIKGIKFVLATKLLGLIGDISKFSNIAKLWRFAGYAVIDGKAEKPVKGEKLHYNKKLKTTLYVIAGNFLKAEGRMKEEHPYVRIYRDARAYYAANRDWTKLHIHYAATRKMIKLFLAHLWTVWRSLEGLPLRKPYVEAYLGHETYDPWLFTGIPKPDGVKEIYLTEEAVK